MPDNGINPLQLTTYKPISYESATTSRAGGYEEGPWKGPGFTGGR